MSLVNKAGFLETNQPVFSSLFSMKTKQKENYYFLKQTRKFWSIKAYREDKLKDILK